MSEPYTPTDAEMGDAYTQMRVRESGSETEGERIRAAIHAFAEYQRWLAAHDAELLRTAAVDVYALSEAMQERADEIEKEADHG